MVSRRGVEQAIGIAALALLAVACFVVLRPFLPAILWAVVLCLSTRPLYARLTRLLGGRRALAAALMVLAVSLLLVLPVAAVSWTLADDVAALFARVHQWSEQGPPPPPDWVATLPLVGERLRARWQALTDAGGNAAPEIAAYVAIARQWLVTFAAALGPAVVELVLSLVIAFFFYRDGEAAADLLGGVGERLAGDRAVRLIHVAAGTIRSVVDGLIGTNLVQAILGAFGFWLAGVPGALLLGFVLFFLTVVPLGAALVFVPAVVWVFHRGDTMQAILLGAWCILVFPVLENVLRPYLITRGSSLPGLLVLLGMLGGLTAFGFLGIFLGPAILAIASALIQEWPRAAAATDPGARADDARRVDSTRGFARDPADSFQA
jgi:predicted PurR-regulated permease PerM